MLVLIIDKICPQKCNIYLYFDANMQLAQTLGQFRGGLQDCAKNWEFRGGSIGLVQTLGQFGVAVYREGVFHRAVCTLQYE